MWSASAYRDIDVTTVRPISRDSIVVESVLVAPPQIASWRHHIGFGDGVQPDQGRSASLRRCPWRIARSAGKSIFGCVYGEYAIVSAG